MKFTWLLAMVLTVLFSIGSAMAVPPGKTVEFAGGGTGKVVFDGKAHADKGAKCADCHTNPKLFAMKKGAEKITMADINAGKACGACHDGTKAFKAGDAANCTKCHKK
jgi:c(7)-type cytochrome triheme protein